jgi:hypothetical protein
VSEKGHIEDYELWDDTDVVAGTAAPPEGNEHRCISMLVVDFHDPDKHAMIRMGRRQALEIITELQGALLDLAEEEGLLEPGQRESYQWENPR